MIFNNNQSTGNTELGRIDEGLANLDGAQKRLEVPRCDKNGVTALSPINSSIIIVAVLLCNTCIDAQ